ncbi:MAG TPA: hypothetical protein VL860_04255 [Planctomycetota bacterium]|nr:hypothetical protein [Planctomycetota bacterium]
MNLRWNRFLVGLCALWFATMLPAGDVVPLAPADPDHAPPGPVVGGGDVNVAQQNTGVEIIAEASWLAPISGPARLVYLTTYGDHAEPFQVTRVFGTGTGIYKFPDPNGVAHYRQYRTVEQESQTRVNYLGKALEQCQSTRRWLDSATREVVRVEFAATSGAPPSYYTAEVDGGTMHLSHRLLPGDDPEKPEGGDTTNDLPIPPGGFIPSDMQFAVDHLKAWGWPVGEVRRFTVFVVEEGGFRTWRMDRLPDEKLDLPHLPSFNALCFRMVTGPAPNAPGYAEWQPEKNLAQGQRFWVNPFTGELLRAETPGPAAAAPRQPGDPDPERTRTDVSYENQEVPALKARLVRAPDLVAHPINRLVDGGGVDYAMVANRKAMGTVHCEFLLFDPNAASPAAGPELHPAPALSSTSAKMLKDATVRSLARLTLNPGQGERRETVESWYLPDGRVRRMLISGERTLQDTIAYVQEIFCVGEICSINGLRIERVPNTLVPGQLVDGRKSTWSRAHVRDTNLRIFDTNRIEQFLALCEQFELREQPDWRVGVYQIQSDTPQILECHLARLTGPAALSQFSAALTVPTRADPDADTYARRTDIQLIAPTGEPAADPNASEWRTRLASGQSAVWLLTMAGPGNVIFAYFGADHRLYAMIQRERDGRELHWVLVPAPDKLQTPAVNPPRVIYPHDW